MSDPIDLDECANEPIHIPGSVQPHGILLVLEPGGFRVEQVSANAAGILGIEPSELLGVSFLERVDPAARDGVAKLIREAASTYVNPFRVPVMTPAGRIVFDGIAHLLDDSATILELERCPAGQDDGSPTDGLDNYLQLIQRSLGKISGIRDIAGISQLMAEKVRGFTGFDRVMVYRFAPDFHGEVIAESAAEGMESFLGLHYPASDIPPQARALYLKTQVRLLQDVDAEPAVMVPAARPRTGKVLDMSRAVLRSMSPIHLQYLRNMEVGASLTLSLVIDGELWGLIACHHRTPRFVSYGIRATACLYATVMSAQLGVKQRSLEDQQAAAARRTALRLLTGFKDYADLEGSFAEALPDFIELFSADGAAVVSDREVLARGSVPRDQVLVQALGQLSSWQEEGLFLSHHTVQDFPALAADLPKAAGVVAINLGESAWLMIFRDEALQTVTWAGDPAGAKSRDDQGRLAPRLSFAAWQETVRHQSLPWGHGVVALTTEIRSGIVELVRKRNLVLERSNHELRRFAGIMAHEVKNQLQAATMALALVRGERGPQLDGGLAQIVDLGVDSLSGLSKFIGEMLDFARADSISDAEDIEFAELASQVVDQLTVGGRVEGTAIQIETLPRVRGLKTQLFHLMSNLVRNALVHARVGAQPLEIRIGSEVRDQIGTVVYVQDNGRGIDASDQQRIFDYFYRSGQSGTGGSGIGLAFCAQIAQRHGHRLWVEPGPAGGASFCFTVTPAG
ncbi:ATP-binding protein [Luteolibacter marinus]|uniref:ATP-binding protein n=1 Tax=Luteolibacter marinus TaxID=2776705 RepID=UPI0018671D26|nr:ATP-binding protein [Luteolibacter marinus]